MSKNQQLFNEYVCKIREKWGNKNSTFEEICDLIGLAITQSAQPDINQEQAQTMIEAIWIEWTRFRATYFMTKSPNEVFTSIKRWPSGKHYYVKIYGNCELIEHKFNTVKEAEAFLKQEENSLKAIGKKIISK